MKNRAKKVRVSGTKRALSSGTAALRADPSRTGPLYKRFTGPLNKQFDRLAEAIVQYVESDDAFGLTENPDPLSVNFFVGLVTNDQAKEAGLTPGGHALVQARDKAGRFAGGNDPAKLAAHLTGLAVKHGRAARDAFKATVAAVASSKIIKGLGKAGRWIKDQTKKLYQRLEARYGRKAAVAIFASGQAISWGAFLGGPAVGLPPIYVPSAAAMVPGAAIAEVYKQVKKLKGATHEPTRNVNADLQPTHIHDLGRELIMLVESLWRNRPPADSMPDIHDGELTGNSNSDEAAVVINGIADRLIKFKNWLSKKIFGTVLSGGEKVWQDYAEAGYKQGAAKAFDDTKKVAKSSAVMKAAATGDKTGINVYDASKAGFLKSAFGHPVSTDKIKVLAGASFSHLKGVTEDMSTAIVRTLTDGLVQGKSPKEIAGDLVKNVEGIGKRRALVIARTEIVRAHAEGQLDTFEQLGVDDLGVTAEWNVAKGACPQCKTLEGTTFTINAAKGMLPRHPQCRCSWSPAVGIEPTYKGKVPQAAKPTLNIDVCACGPHLDLFSEYLTNANPEGCNQYTGPGCAPKPPEFHSMDMGNVSANIKAVKELKAHAEAYNLHALEAHPGTPSPKVQAYKAALVKHVSEYLHEHGSPQEKTGLFGKLKSMLGMSSTQVPAHPPEGNQPKASGVVKEALKAHAHPDNPSANATRVKVANDIYTGNTEVKDAINKVLDKHQPAADLLKKITTGPDAEKAQKEYSQTPYHDLAILSKITVKDTPVQGQAVCNMATRSLTMGATSATGDYRHELGHAIHASYITGGPHSAITQRVEELYAKAMEKVKADPSGMKTKLSHEEYEAKYGVPSRRALDNSKELFAEFYRVYHREVYRDRQEGGGGKHLAAFRDKHPEWAKIFDAHYTTALMAME